MFDDLGQKLEAVFKELRGQGGSRCRDAGIQAKIADQFIEDVRKW